MDTFEISMNALSNKYFPNLQFKDWFPLPYYDEFLNREQVRVVSGLDAIAWVMYVTDHRDYPKYGSKKHR